MTLALIGWEHLCDDIAHALRAPAAPATTTDETSLDLRALSRVAVDRAIEDSEGNLSEAARRLGISRNALYRRLRR